MTRARLDARLVLRLSSDELERWSTAAREHNRSVSGFVRWVLGDYLATLDVIAAEEAERRRLRQAKRRLAREEAERVAESSPLLFPKGHRY